MNILCSTFFSISLIVTGFSVQAQPGAPGYVDNALNYNRLIREKTGEGIYKLIGPYKVIGTSYLFGEKVKGNLFTQEAKAYNISLSYNTYNQEVEFYSTSNPDQPLIKEPGTADSFSLSIESDLGSKEELKFIYGAVLGSSDKAYYKQIYAGKRFGIYKRYRSELGYVSSNYVQSELRQFDLLYDYYYTDNEKKEKGTKKLKANVSNIIKEFKDIKDVSTVLTNDSFNANQETALRKAFEYLNE
jgi:hypothetical protein